MSEPFVGQIKMFAGNFPPRSYAFCDGQLLAVSSNDALFSLLGTIYGGDGRTTFGLPDLRGRLPVHTGTGPALTLRPMGQKAGAETVGLTEAQIAAHRHESASMNTTPTLGSPGGNVLANTGTTNIYGAPSPPNTNLAPEASIAAGGGSGTAHTNLMPFQCVTFIIALFGIYPSRQ